jgi:nucleotide-binding universal stress UspA family protein
MRTKTPTKPDTATGAELTGAHLPAAEGPSIHPLTLKQILVPIDFSDCSTAAFDCALALAEKFEAKVTLLHVVEPAAYPENCLLNPATPDEVNQKLIKSGRERLARLKNKARGHARSVDSMVRMGRAHSEIPDTAKAIAADLIVLGTRGANGLKQMSLGGTAERVVRLAHCAVLTIPNTKSP